MKLLGGDAELVKPTDVVKRLILRYACPCGRTKTSYETKS